MGMALVVHFSFHYYRQNRLVRVSWDSASQTTCVNGESILVLEVIGMCLSNYGQMLLITYLYLSSIAALPLP